MAKGFIFVGGVIGILNHCNILLSNTMLNSFEKLAIHQQKLVYQNKKTILDTPNNQPADKSSNRLLPTLTTDKELQGTDGAKDLNVQQVLKDLGTGVRQQLPSGVEFPKSSNILSVIPPAQSETKNSVQLKKSSFSNILIPHYFIRQKAATTLLLPGTPSYLTRLLSSQQFPTLQQFFSILKEPALPIMPVAPLLDSSKDTEVPHRRDLILHDLNPTTFASNPVSNDQAKDLDLDNNSVPLAKANDDAPGTNEITERVVTSEEEANVATEDAQEEANVAEKEAEVVVALNAVAPEEAKEEAKVAPEEINKIPDSQSEESNFAPNISTENNLPNNFALEIPAPSNEQVDDVIKALPQEQIDQIVEEARSQELKVLEELKTFYRTLREELKNPPQKHDDFHKQKRELIVKNIDNILQDIKRSEKNINDGISVNRHKALIKDDPFSTKQKLHDIDQQRKTREQELDKFYTIELKIHLNYNEKELDQVDAFVKESGKDIKHIAHTRNDDMRRKFFSSIVDHTISFAKYNINWAPAAYNLTWAVGSYIIMGIVVDTIAQGAKSISNSYKVGIKISDNIKKISGQGDEKQTANLFTRSIATLSGIIGGGATMIIMPPIMLTFTGTKNVLYTPVGIYKNYQSYKKNEDGTTKNWAKSRTQLKSERTLEKNRVHKVKEQKKFAETVQSQKPVSSNIR